MDFVFGVEAGRSVVRGRELTRKWAISRLRQLDTAKPSMQSWRSRFKLNSSQLAINFILFSVFLFAEFIASGISPDI